MLRIEHAILLAAMVIPPMSGAQANVITDWDTAAIAIAAPAPAGQREMAILHAAMFDAVNSIERRYWPYLVDLAAAKTASAEAAATAAAAGVLTGLHPEAVAQIKSAMASSLAAVPDGTAKTDGLAVGRTVAEQTLISRITDGANAFVPYTPGTNPGDWRPTPPAFAPAQTPQWPFVTPFALDSGSQFRPGPPPALTSAAYTAAFNEVKDIGRVDSTVRTAQQTEVARFWEAKAGTPQIAG